MLQLGLGLGLGLGTGNEYCMPFFFFLKVTNTFVLPSWAEAWCKCDVMLFIRDCLHGSLPGFPRKHSNGSHTRKSYSGRSKAHLAVSTERVWFQTRGGALGVNRVRLLLWATMAARILRHHVVIARLRASLITSFQPPKLTPSARGC